MKHNELPLVDMEALHALEESLLGQKTLSRNVVGSFVQMWTQRDEGRTHALSLCEWADTTDAALSLYSSSSLAGASRLSELSADIVHFLKIGHYLKAAAMLDGLHRCGEQTMAQLTITYLQQDSCG